MLPSLQGYCRTAIKPPIEILQLGDITVCMKKPAALPSSQHQPGKQPLQLEGLANTTAQTAPTTSQKSAARAKGTP